MKRASAFLVALLLTAPAWAVTIPPLDKQQHGRAADQGTSEALVRCVVDDGGCPPWLPELIPAIRKRIGDSDSLENLRHLALAVALELRITGTEERLLRFYELDRSYHRGDFEGLSVGYGGYQRLSAWAVMLSRFGSDALHREARGFLRRDYTIAALAADRHGQVVLACGRAYAQEVPEWTEGGVGDPALDFEIRTLLDIDDGWWPPRGVGPKFWAPHRDGVPAWPLRARPRLAGEIFSPAERQALRGWVMERRVAPELKALLAEIRWPPVLHVVAWPGGHLAWAEDLRSYGGGKNASQPLAWADGDTDRWVVREPPSGAERIGPTTWRVFGRKADDATFEISVPAGAVEIIVDGDGGGIAGQAPAPAPAPAQPPAAPPEPTPPPGAGDQATSPNGCDAACRADIAADLRKLASKIRQGKDLSGWAAALEGFAKELEGGP